MCKHFDFLLITVIKDWINLLTLNTLEFSLSSMLSSINIKGVRCLFVDGQSLSFLTKKSIN